LEHTEKCRGDGVYLFAWDDWPSHGDGIGHYALSARTHASLRSYFGLSDVTER
jgi:hypothetical protein